MVDKTTLETIFLNISAAGYKKPTLRADGFIFKLAPVHGANPGAVYITREADGEYLGKLHHGKLKLLRAYLSEEPAIEQIAAQPQDAALRYGRRTGNCACCGRHLDNAQSVELGIGPICAEKFGWLAGMLAPQDLPDDSLDDIDWSIL
jgi:hypothetical protein